MAELTGPEVDHRAGRPGTEPGAAEQGVGAEHVAEPARERGVPADAAFVLRCPRCGRDGTGTSGCPHCRAEGVAVNLEPPLADLTAHDLAAFPGGPWGWRETVPIPGGAAVVTLGEGNTPNVWLPPRPDGRGVWLKNEAANPTLTHKDRYMAAAMATARAQGFETVIAASSGNAGASAAAYAARAGLRCVVVTKSSLPPAIHAQILAAGAVVVGFDDSVARNNTMRQAVEQLGWFPLTNFVEPGAGGHPYAIEGLKSIAYELARDFGDELGAVVVPTSRADLLSGVSRGFKEIVAAGLLRACPRLIAAEPSVAPAFSTALARPGLRDQETTQIPYVGSAAFSIGSDVANWQGLQALRDSGGEAVAVDEATFLDEYRRCAAEDGIFIEASSAVAVSVARGVAGPGTVVALGTSSGLKDLDLALRGAPDLPVIEENLDELQRVVADAAKRA
ncbi:pyridoxal-phosphate dependent enzyme [Phytoactinopolyspora alkaliphila]|uniref:Pyridoxal-phosphate dependent enzyme n=1 Tax=Phytoactinopolyspora alkaliphila TaxID=1783498 RepID=A0A6N9YN24_9ACTN|nr:pyridoxal-phosphate dependent enzyme [Phytoactinopolyspora alkaliphila]NED96384.1 pyridoxal-phosphate dependent enzyme [Phytoactinopolyspora alkaliphila]